MPTSGAPRMPAPLSYAIRPALTATKNGSAYTASVKISQQNKPIPTVLRTSPRASMVVAPCIDVTVAPSTTTAAQFGICNRNEAELRRLQLHLGGSEGGKTALMRRQISK